MTRIFDEIRNGGKYVIDCVAGVVERHFRYPTRVGDFPVKAIRDLTKGIDTRPAAVRFLLQLPGVLIAVAGYPLSSAYHTRDRDDYVLF
jgi:hypothetical protein